LVELHEKDPSRSSGAGMKFALWGLKVRFGIFGILEPKHDFVLVILIFLTDFEE
jgi:hypothetical protein